MNALVDRDQVNAYLDQQYEGHERKMAQYRKDMAEYERQNS